MTGTVTIRAAPSGVAKRAGVSHHGGDVMARGQGLADQLAAHATAGTKHNELHVPLPPYVECRHSR